MLRDLLGSSEAVHNLAEARWQAGSDVSAPLLHFGLCKVRQCFLCLAPWRNEMQCIASHLLNACFWFLQEWDYAVLTVADPLTRLLQLAEAVRASSRHPSTVFERSFSDPQLSCCYALLQRALTGWDMRAGASGAAGGVLQARVREPCSAGGCSRPSAAV